MTIVIQHLFVLCVSKTIFVHESMGSLKRDSLPDTPILDTWKQFQVHILLKTARHFFINKMLDIFFCSQRYGICFSEFCNLG